MMSLACDLHSFGIGSRAVHILFALMIKGELVVSGNVSTRAQSLPYSHMLPEP